MTEAAVKSGHVNALRESIAPDVRIGTFQKFTYRIVEIPGNDMILGDTGLVLKELGTRRFCFISEKGVEYSKVYLPVSKSQILVGECESNGGIDLNEVKLAIAGCSHEFFIGAGDTEENRALQCSIGMYAQVVDKVQLKELAYKGFLESIKTAAL